uniref:Uncharacterized protein n=1 Tax=Panagrolaimus superbus TaxID=310955 RepID=A0A914YSH7_9BILA
MKSSEPLNSCHQDLQINGYLPDIDAEEASLSELECLSEDSYDYYQELFVSKSISIQQPLELLVNVVTNSFLPNTKFISCSGRASTSTGSTANSGRTSSLGTAPIRTKPPAPGSVAGRTSLSAEEKQAQKSGFGFFHRKNGRFHSRSGGFESSSGSDDASSSTTDDESLQQANQQNKHQTTKATQPISSSLNKLPQERRNTVRNGSLPNRLSQTPTTPSRTSVNSINKITAKTSTSANQTIAPTKQRSSSTISVQRKNTSINNSVQKSTTLRSNSANPGSSKTSGKFSVQKAQNVEKELQREKPPNKNESQNGNVQKPKEKETVTLATTPYASKPQNYTTIERPPMECQEALTFAKKGGKEKKQSSFDISNQKNQSAEMDTSWQTNKGIGGENNACATTTTINMDSTMDHLENMLNRKF